ncbi:peptidylprolyl isomerase [Sphingobium subterraneum]|uniref:peptidylprolyl isomerase n=1 Tax=Sphingobium subterraneum TaxID=627688 RepID=A0A841J0P5_9SPHN|nr:peptidylprolyl isomerase [Sphingobium subterraneum]MBB6124417.1 peptidyl-prolyl cis-trans isomerase A (cyclophilin A) [Sphingobium subterraneum]
MVRPAVFLPLLAMIAGGPVVAQTQPVPSPVPEAVAPQRAPAPRPATVKVSLQTSEGPILLELEKERAPVTTANFLRYVDQKRLDGTTFYRALNLAPGYGLIQGGLRNDPRKLFPPVAHEPTSKTGVSHVDGTISMARNAPGSATADFFIVLGEMKSLDADPAAPGDNAGFAAFGHVAEGMDVVKRILAAPISPTAGEGAMKGQMIAAPVKILSARRVTAMP